MTIKTRIARLEAESIGGPVIIVAGEPVTHREARRRAGLDPRSQIILVIDPNAGEVPLPPISDGAHCIHI